MEWRINEMLFRGVVGFFIEKKRDDGTWSTVGMEYTLEKAEDKMRELRGLPRDKHIKYYYYE